MKQGNWSDVKRILRNIGYIFGCGVFRALLTPLFLVIIARRLGAEDFGSYSFAVFLASILLVLGDMGLSKLVVRSWHPDATRPPATWEGSWCSAWPRGS